MPNLFNWRIGTRLGLGFATILLAMVAMVAVVLMQLSSMASRVQSLAEVGVVELTKLSHSIAAIEARAIAARNLVLEPDAAKHAGIVTHIQKLSTDVSQHLKGLESAVSNSHSSNSATLKRMVGELKDMEARYVPITVSVAESMMASRRAEATEKLFRDCKPLLDNIMTLSAQLQTEVEKASTEEVQAAIAAYERARWVAMVAASLTLVGGALIAWLLTRSITLPVSEAVQVARTVASGDLTSNIRAQRNDELGELLQALKAMNDNLANVVVGVRSASDAIATGTGQIASGNADLSQRTETQASSLQETAASMEELNVTVRNNAETASQAASLASAASHAAERGGEAVGQVVSTMDDISQSSRKVVEIISVIDGIAFQTNILALNAAVEAARAGEQGRGFAVVAGEVRVLAQRSASAAKEIKQLIAASADRVDEGTRLVADAGRSMDDIMSQVKRVSDLLEGINAATSQQTAGISQVNSAVSQLDQATQQNAALVEESAAAAESLRQQARHLVDAVGAFRLPSDAVAASSIAKASATSKAVAHAAHAPHAAPRPVVKPRVSAPAAPAASQGHAASPQAGGDGDWDTF